MPPAAAARGALWSAVCHHLRDQVKIKQPPNNTSYVINDIKVK
jgi:hypothetical protein